nr:putative ribonuclease H-like domain-containing protein [Tanacetum cinerariifolium]
MHEELLQFKLLNVWTLVELPHGKRAIGTKWVFKNKRDQRGIVVRNKAMLVAQGHRQEEGVDYNEVFALVTRIEAIRLFLAYASFMNFTVYQMDVKCAFLYGTIEEEVYVSQPLGFVDLKFLDRVYKVEKALYDLHQALKAWFETLSTYLLENGFRRRTIDKTLFIKQIKNDILLIQVYVMTLFLVEAMHEELLQFKLLNVWTLVELPHGKRAIGTKWVFKNKRDQRGIVVRNKAMLVAQGHRQEEGVDYNEVFALVTRIEAISQPLGFVDLKFLDRVYKVEKALYDLHQALKAWFETLSTYLLENGFRRRTIDKTLFIKQIKNDILLIQVIKSTSTPMETHKPLSKDTNGTDVDVHLYRYLKGQPALGLWYPKDSPLKLIASSDSDYTGLELKGYLINDGYANLVNMLVTLLILLVFLMLVFTNTTNGHKFTMSNRQERISYSRANGNTLDNEEIELNATVDGHNRTITEAFVKRHLKLIDADGISTLPTTEIFAQLALMGKTRTKTRRMGIRIPQSNVLTNVADNAITKEINDGLRRATTTTSSLEAEQGSGNIAKTQTKATPSGPRSLRTSTKGSPGCHFTIRDSPVQARSERVSNLPNEPPLGEGNTSRRGESSMQLLELMDICTTLSIRVTTLENELSTIKAVYHKALITLTKRVKKL